MVVEVDEGDIREDKEEEDDEEAGRVEEERREGGEEGREGGPRIGPVGDDEGDVTEAEDDEANWTLVDVDVVSAAGGDVSEDVLVLPLRRFGNHLVGAFLGSLVVSVSLVLKVVPFALSSTGPRDVGGELRGEDPRDNDPSDDAVICWHPESGVKEVGVVVVVGVVDCTSSGVEGAGDDKSLADDEDRPVSSVFCVVC